jgi:hypothetical protein
LLFRCYGGYSAAMAAREFPAFGGVIWVAQGRRNLAKAAPLFNEGRRWRVDQDDLADVEPEFLPSGSLWPAINGGRRVCGNLSQLPC